MDTMQLASVLTDALQGLIASAMLVLALMTVTGNFASKRFLGRCGIGLRGRYLAALIVSGCAVLVLAGVFPTQATTVLVVVLMLLATLLFRARLMRAFALSAAMSASLVMAELVP